MDSDAFSLHLQYCGRRAVYFSVLSVFLELPPSHLVLSLVSSLILHVLFLFSFGPDRVLNAAAAARPRDPGDHPFQNRQIIHFRIWTRCLRIVASRNLVHFQTVVCVDTSSLHSRFRIRNRRRTPANSLSSYHLKLI